MVEVPLDTTCERDRECLSQWPRMLDWINPASTCPDLARTPSGSLTHMEIGKLRCLMRSLVPGLWLRCSPEHNFCIHSHSLSPNNRTQASIEHFPVVWVRHTEVFGCV